MPTHQDETLQQRYQREHQDYLKLCGSMTAQQVADLHLQLNNALARDALQQRLTAADERADVLERLLRQTNELLYAIQGDPGAVPSSSIDAMRGEVFTALKQAKPETIAGHHPACRAVDDYKPGDCSHSCKPVDEPHAVEDSHLFDTCRLIGGKFKLYAEQPAPIATAPFQEDRETLIGYGRSSGLEEASTLCARLAYAAYYPPGTRFKAFTPKAQKALDDLLIKAANEIASLPGGPYERFKARQAKKAESAKSR